MPSSLALALWAILLVLLLRHDPARDPVVSRAHWIAVVWLIILASRLPSQWLGTTSGSVASALEEGNPLDRVVYLILILLSLAVLRARAVRWSSLLAANATIVSFILFALLSVAWSDFPEVAFRRWVRDIGHYVIILVVLTDQHPLASIHAVVRRLCYALIPLSVVLVKYFPGLGTEYDIWTGAPSFMGASTGKNGLGALCLLSGVFFLWDTLRRWPARHNQSTQRIIFVNAAFMGMTLWLMQLSASATSQVCLLIAWAVILTCHSGTLKTRATVLKVALPTSFALYFLLDLFWDVSDLATAALGREIGFTGRSDVWTVVLALNTNPLVGTGYESFWLGDRLLTLWTVFQWHPTQAHNGYLEIYLNLGFVGLALVVGFLLSSYRHIWSSPTLELLSFSLAMWCVLVIYNVTEAAFKANVLWLVFFMVSIVVPPRTALILSTVPERDPTPGKASAL